jgi:tellurium resistance protein TerD
MMIVTLVMIFQSQHEGSQMALSLEKGTSVNLTKVAADAGSSLRTVTVGLGWKAADRNAQAQQKRGFFRSRGASAPQQDYDLDASAFVLNSAGSVLDRNWFVWYSNKSSPGSVVKHSGDNLVGGSGNNDDEQIVVKLDRLPAEATRVVFVVNIYQARSKGQSFGDVDKAFMRVVNDGGVEMARYNLVESFDSETAVTFGELRRQGNDWELSAIGKGQVADLNDLARQYGTKA